MSTLIEAIPETEARTGQKMTVIGGLAVICRLQMPHRATSDLDTVNRRKLQSLPDRPSMKEATDLFDIVRLTLDGNAGSVVRRQLGEADPQLRSDAALHVERRFDTSADRSLKLLRGIPEAGDVVRDDLELVCELLTGTLLG